MFTGVIDSTELRSRGGSSSQAGCGSSSRSRCSVSSMEEAMREQQEKFREEMATTNGISPTTIRVHGCLQRTDATSNERECLIYSQHARYWFYNLYIIFATVLVSTAGTAATICFPSISAADASVGITCSATSTSTSGYSI
jgi:hypothetical protein